MQFQELHLIEPLLRAVAATGYTTPTPIQQKAIPHLIEGRDLIGCAQTGTGKTAAFALPVLQRLSAHPAHPGSGHHRPVRALILSPTRELAAQIGESFASYGRHLHLKHTVIFGGVGQDAQVRALRAGVDIVVATPGRLLDLMQQKLVRFDQIEVFILDEADRMLDMGFIHDVRRIIAVLPARRQTLLFSATMPEEIRSLSQSILTDPVRVEVAPISATADRIEQSVHFVARSGKRALLAQLLRDPTITRALVFTRTKHGANRVAEQLDSDGVAAQAIHGNKSQGARERALSGFKNGTVRVLVATDIAARGIDVDDVSHVFNFDLPEVAEQYVHRIGRTARAGASGIAVAFCDAEERPLLRDIERLIRARLTIASGSPDALPTETAELRRGQPQQRRGGGGGRSQGGGRPSQGGRPQQGGGRPAQGGGGRPAQGGGGRPAQGGGDRRSTSPATPGQSRRRRGGRGGGGGETRSVGR